MHFHVFSPPMSTHLPRREREFTSTESREGRFSSSHFKFESGRVVDSQVAAICLFKINIGTYCFIVFTRQSVSLHPFCLSKINIFVTSSPAKQSSCHRGQILRNRQKTRVCCDVCSLVFLAVGQSEGRPVVSVCLI